MTTLPVAPPVAEEYAEQVPEHRGFVTQLLQNRKFMVGLTIFGALALAALVTNLLTDPALRSTGSFLPRLRPGGATWLGTDSVGRSIAIQLGEAIPKSLMAPCCKISGGGGWRRC